MLTPVACVSGLLQVRALIQALRMGIHVLMLDMDTSPSVAALDAANNKPNADIVYVDSPYLLHHDYH